MSVRLDRYKSQSITILETFIIRNLTVPSDLFVKFIGGLLRCSQC
jgi:hypothetical protein